MLSYLIAYIQALILSRRVFWWNLKYFGSTTKGELVSSNHLGSHQLEIREAESMDFLSPIILSCQIFPIRALFPKLFQFSVFMNSSCSLWAVSKSWEDYSTSRIFPTIRKDLRNFSTTTHANGKRSDSFSEISCERVMWFLTLIVTHRRVLPYFRWLRKICCLFLS